MASNLDFVEYVVDQLGGTKPITYKKMFGEYAVYCDGKIVLRITKSGCDFVGPIKQAPPYPGAKPHFLTEEQLENRHWLSQLIAITTNELPDPKPKKKMP